MNQLRGSGNEFPSQAVKIAHLRIKNSSSAAELNFTEDALLNKLRSYYQNPEINLDLTGIDKIIVENATGILMKAILMSG